ncbi:MAG: hypothetical protein ABI557_15445, partial [Aureliella sp.]
PTTTAPSNKPTLDRAVDGLEQGAARSAANQKRRQSGRLFRLAGPLILSAILGLSVLGLGYLQATLVSGIELNSHTWEQRVFSFRRDPFTGAQLGGVRHNAPVSIDFFTTVVNPRSKKLDPAIQAHLKGSLKEPVRWDLIRIDDSQLPAARASILVDLLEATGPKADAFWPSWSIVHPKRAAVLWPAAQQLVAHDLYTQLPQLFSEALLENSPEEFSSSAGQLVKTALAEAPQP